MIDFLKYKYISIGVSVLLLVGGLFAYFTRGVNYHVDFSGGSEIRLTFDQSMDIGHLRTSLSEIGFKDAVIQSHGRTGKSFMIQVKKTEDNLESSFEKLIKDKFKENPATIDSIDWIGPEVGKDIKFKALLSVLLSLLLILLYVTFRSKYYFGIGAVVALAHDMLAVIACFLIFGEQISSHVLAAILTVLGYSINDTIVIFSRVKENMIKFKNRSMEEIVNLSINQTLRRTTLTSVTTFLAVGSILLLGGEALRGFSLAMLIGIVVGTYSSIYIASPVMLAFFNPPQES